MPRTRPSIFAYLSYRDFLESWLDHQRDRDPGYSYTTFAAASGLSRSTLPNVLSGSRTPSTKTLDGIARALELDPNERNYLGALVELEHAPSVASRREVLERILDRQSFQQRTRMEEHPDRSRRYASRWYYAAVRELALHPGFRADPSWLAETLVPSISQEEAQDALDTLVELDQLELTEDGGARVTRVRLSTDSETASEGSRRFHEEIVPELLREVTAIPPEQRHLLGTITLLPTDAVPDAKALLNSVQSQVVAMGDVPGEAGPRQVYQLTIQLIPLTRPVGK